jgi:putative FmdB family regulatory protein
LPLYEYQCKKCGHRFEKIQTFSAPEIKECPVCGSEVEKLISAPAIQFKGSGWYVSDYGKGGAAGSNTKPDTHKSGDSGKSEGSPSGSGDSSSSSSESKSSESKPSTSSSDSSSSSSASPAPAAPSTSGSSSKKD